MISSSRIKWKRRNEQGKCFLRAIAAITRYCVDFEKMLAFYAKVCYNSKAVNYGCIAALAASPQEQFPPGGKVKWASFVKCAKRVSCLATM